MTCYQAMLPIIKAVGKACMAVSRLVRQAQRSSVLDPQDPDTLLKAADVREEDMRELQTLANKIFLKGLCQPHVMSCVASSDESVVRMCSAVVGEESHGWVPIKRRAMDLVCHMILHRLSRAGKNDAPTRRGNRRLLRPGCGGFLSEKSEYALGLHHRSCHISPSPWSVPARILMTPSILSPRLSPYRYLFERS